MQARAWGQGKCLHTQSARRRAQSAHVPLEDQGNMRRALSDVQGCRERLGFAAVSQCKTGHLAKARCYPKSMLAEWRLHVLGMLSLNKYRTLLTVAKAWVYSPGARAQAVSLLEALSLTPSAGWGKRPSSGRTVDRGLCPRPERATEQHGPFAKDTPGGQGNSRAQLRARQGAAHADALFGNLYRT